MRKLLFLLVLFFTLCACNKFRVRHDHSKVMESARVPVDTAQRDYVDDMKDDSWKDEPLISIPEETGNVDYSSDSGEELEKMLSGEE